MRSSCGNTSRYTGKRPPRCMGGKGCPPCRKKYAEAHGADGWTPGRSLKDFIKDEKKKDCRICALPPEVLEQVRSASQNKIPRATVVRWLKTEFNITLTSDEFDKHSSGRH